MRNKRFTTLIFTAFVFALLAGFNASAQIAVKGETIWTMEGSPITNGVILIKNGKIEAVGTAAQVSIPAGYTVINAKVVTPGLIDSRTVIGLNGYLNQPHDQMALDGGGSFQPELRAIDAYNAEEKLVEWVRQFGVTTIHTGHQPSALSPGQTMIAKTWGKNVEDATLVSTAMVAVTLGNAANAGQGRSPGTRAKQVAMLRAELIKAQDNAKKAEAPRDLRAAVMVSVIKREIPLLVNAHRAQDIMSALRIAKEFNVRIVLDGAAESMVVLDEIKKAGVPVIIHPTMARPGGDAESLSMETAKLLRAAGVPVVFQSGYEGYVPKTRVVLFEAAMAAGAGLSREDAMAMLTIDAAKLLGLDSRIGSLKVGKDADIAMYDGDPFEWITRCTGTIINGKVASDIVR
ncbi:MAG: amidohydrolase family protein [Acidobacteriota bacterium]|nr:MAG: amidohydrolase family protein [Acidobacteriota bacterium]